MVSLTPNGSLPYPDPGDDFTDTDLYIRNLAEAVDAIYAPWTAYTPALTNGTVGNGVLEGKYRLVGATLDLRGSFILGSTSTITGTFGIGLPAGITFSEPDAGTALAGTVHLLDTSAAVRRYRFPRVITASVFQIVDADNTAVSGAVPWTWATSDRIDWALTAEAA